MGGAADPRIHLPKYPGVVSCLSGNQGIKETMMSGFPFTHRWIMVSSPKGEGFNGGTLRPVRERPSAGSGGRASRV